MADLIGRLAFLACLLESLGAFCPCGKSGISAGEGLETCSTQNDLFMGAMPIEMSSSEVLSLKTYILLCYCDGTQNICMI